VVGAPPTTRRSDPDVSLREEWSDPGGESILNSGGKHCSENTQSDSSLRLVNWGF
jgi:hypothetical protein